MAGHTEAMGAAAAATTLDVKANASSPRSDLRLEDVYERCFDFVWRSARRMGVPEPSVDDVVQEVFVVAHRRLADFEGRSTVKTWLFGILLRVVSDYRRTQRRKGGLAPLPEVLEGDGSDCPAAAAEQRERVRLLHALLSELDDDKRAVFVLYEIEQLEMPEVADALSCPLQTAYSRLYAARKIVKRAVLAATEGGAR